MKHHMLAGMLLLAATAATMSSCKKALDQDPYNQANAEFAFNKPSDFLNNTRGMYNRMVFADQYIGGEDNFSWISSMDILADNVNICQTGRFSQNTFFNYNYSGNETSNAWGNAYRIIRSANAILANIGKLEEEDARNAFESEALAVRAMSHFDLLRLYGPALTGQHADANALAVPYVTSLDINLKPSRETAGAVYAKVVADLEKAVVHMPVANEAGRLTQAAVYGLLSRVYLYGGEWQKCIDAAAASLAQNNNVGAIASFPAIWKDATTQGVLFKVIITDIDRVRPGVAFNQSSPQGVKNEYVPDFGFYESFDSLDVRKASYFKTSTYSGVSYNAIVKYTGKTGAAANVVDIKYLRVAEVLLNKAEAEASLNKDGDALTDLNELRTNRYANFTPGTESGSTLKEAIRGERRKELAFEGHRFFDLKRWGLAVTRTSAGDRADGSGVAPLVQELPAGDHRFLLPIPQDEINASSNKIIQNPGY